MRNLAQLHAQPAGFLLEILLADLDSLGPLAGVDQVLDPVSRARGLDDGQPVFARLVAGLRQDLDDVAIAQRVAQGYDPAVDLGAHARLAYVRVNPVPAIHRRAVARQHDDFSARRERIDFLG